MKASEYLKKSTSENQGTAKQIYEKIDELLKRINSKPPISLGKEIHNLIKNSTNEVRGELSQMLADDGWKLDQPWEGTMDDGRSGDYVLKIK